MEREPADGCDSMAVTTRGTRTTRTSGDGAETPPTSDPRTRSRNGDIHAEDLATLRCSSLQIEELSERRRHRQPSAGYPGLAFGAPMYSNAMLKFSLIANELKDLKHNQLRKVSRIGN